MANQKNTCDIIQAGTSTIVHLIPVNEMRFSDPDRVSDLQSLVAQMVLSSSKKGRPSKQSKEEVLHAA